MIKTITKHLTDRYISATLTLTVLLNVVLWVLWLKKTPESPLPVFYASFIIILNLILSQFSYIREKLASYVLVGFSFFIQVLMLILLYNIISLQNE